MSSDFTIDSSLKGTGLPSQAPIGKGTLPGHHVTPKATGVLNGKNLVLPTPLPQNKPANPLESSAVTVQSGVKEAVSKQIDKVNSVFPKPPKIENEEFVNKLADLKNHPGEHLAKVNGKYVYTSKQEEALTPQQIKNEIETAHNQIEKAFNATENVDLKGEIRFLALNLSLGCLNYRLNDESDENFSDITRKLDDQTKKMSDEIDFIEKVQEEDATRDAVRTAAVSKTNERLTELLGLMKSYREFLQDKTIDISQKKETMEKFRAVIKEINEINEFNNSSSKAMEIFYAHLDPSYGQVSSLENINSKDALKSVSSELNNYQDKAQLATPIAELVFAQKMEEELSEIRTPADRPKLEEANKKIMDAVKALPMPVTGSQSPCVLLQGGYKNAEKGGHAAMYQIEREGPDKFKFTVINTGEQAKGANGRSVDVVYTNLTAEQLSNCLLKLNEYRTFLPTDPNMEKVYKTIEDHLLQKDANGVTNQREGTSHRLQKQGTCSVRCILSWLYSRIGREAYRKIRPGSMQRIMNSAQEELNKFKNNHTWKMNTFGTSDDRVIQVLSKRLFFEMEVKIKKLTS